MKKPIQHTLLLTVCLLQFICKGQTTFDNYYTTGYHNNKSSNVIAEADSGFVFVNYIVDSATQRIDMGLLRLDKNGNEVIKNSFNMFYESYHSFVSGMKNFIEATPSSYFLSGGYFIGNQQGFIITKFNKNTLDTIKTITFSDNYSYGVNPFIKFNDNKYYLIGNRWLGNNGAPVIFHLDSNLNIVQTIHVNTGNDFTIWDAIYNPVNKKILLSGGTASGQYLNTFFYIDTLGNPIQGAYGPKYYQYRHILQVFYSSIDTSYVVIGDLKTGAVNANFGMYKLCIGKYDLNLNLMWEKTYGDAMPATGLYDGVVMDNGDIALSGTYSQLTSLPLTNANMNGVILKTDKDGNLKWAKGYDHVAPGNLYELLYGIDKTLDKGFILCGNVFGPPSNKSKAWAIKTDSMGCVTPGCPSLTMQVTSITYPPPPPPPPIDTTTTPTNTVGLAKNFLLKNGFKIYPNPASQVLKVEIPTTYFIDKKEYRLTITNALGQTVLSNKISGSFFELDISTLKNGIYFLQVFDKEKLLVTEKFLKE